MPRNDRQAAGLTALPPWLVNAAAAAGCVLLIAIAVWLFSGLVVRLTVVVVPVLLALLLAAIFQPVVARLSHPRLPEWLLPLAAVMFTLAVIVGLCWLTGNRVSAQLDDLRRDAAQLRQTIIERTGFNVPPVPGTSDAGGSPATQEGQGQSAPAGGSGSGGGFSDGARDAARQALATATEVLVGLFLTLALAFLFLKDGPAMWQWILAHMGAGVRDHVDAAGQAAWSTLAVYVRGLTIVALFDAAAIAIGLLVLGVPLVLTLAILQFVGSYIPTFGAFIAGTVAVAVALVSGGLVTAALTLLLIVAVQQIGNDVIEPWVMGRTLPLHAAVVLIAVTTGGVLWGIAGALLFVPLAAALAAATHAVRLSRNAEQGATSG